MPTDKRQRQKEGRRVRLEAQRKQDRRRQLLRRAAIVIVVAGVIIGSVILFTQHSPKPLTATQKAQQSANEAAHSVGCPPQPATPTKPANTLKWKKQPPMRLDKSALYYAQMSTTQGGIVVKLNVKGAPVNVNNFVFLADHGFYVCNPIWRVIPGFMNQTGDPTGGGSGGPGYSVNKNEFPPAVKSGVQYPKGAVAMANSCSTAITDPAKCPTTNASQFFIVAKPLTAAELPPKYTIIGQVVGSYTALEKINAQGDPNVATETGGINGNHPAVLNQLLSVKIFIH